MPPPLHDNAEVAKCLGELPRTLKIGAYDWVITFEASDSELEGQAEWETHFVRLWPAALTSPSHVVGTVLHECLHVIFGNQRLESLKRTKEDREEQIVGGFEAGLVSLFRDNPKFLTWIKRWLGKPL